MPLDKAIIRSNRVPAPIGPYSQATRLGNLVFTAGMGGVDPATGKPADGVREQTRQTLENLRSVLEAAGTSLQHALKSTCYLQNLDDFAAFNEVYTTFFPQSPPARTTIQAARLPADLLVEIDMVAFVPEG